MEDTNNKKPVTDGSINNECTVDKCCTDQSNETGLSYEQEKQIALERMQADNFIINVIGAKLVDFSCGHALVELEVTEKHLNGVSICQGGVIYSVADYAFACASNWGDVPAVGIVTNIVYHKSVQAGAKITAEAQLISKSRKLATVSVAVSDQDGKCIASFTGTAYFLKNK